MTVEERGGENMGREGQEKREDNFKIYILIKESSYIDSFLLRSEHERPLH